jgi:putative DNA primase/helicase
MATDFAHDPPPPSEEHSRAEVARLSALSPFEYDRQRIAVAETLEIRPSTLDKEVNAARKERGRAEGQAIAFAEVEPWPNRVEGAELLHDMSLALRSCVALESWQSDIVMLWILHDHAIDAFDFSPRLGFTAPAPGCGKTQALRFLKRTTVRPYMCVMVTESTLFRLIEAAHPTLLVDELDNGLSVEAKSAILGVMNSGHQRGILVPRCVGQRNQVRGFATFGPMAYAMIGRPPGTFDSRTIPIELRRATGAAWRELRPVVDLERRLYDLNRQAARWASDSVPKLKAARPDMGVIANRDADNWRPLFAIADLIGDGWGERARHAAERVLSLGANRSYGEMVLLDIKEILDASSAEEFPSSDLVEQLLELPGRAWSEYGRQRKPITPTALAYLLSPFKIATGKVGPKNKRLNGYTRWQFQDAFDRYLSTSSHSNQTTGQSAIPDRHLASPDADSGVRFETVQKSKTTGLESGCPVWHGGPRQEWDGLEIPPFLRRVGGNLS